MDTVLPAHQEARWVSHALPVTQQRHHHIGEVWHHWHRSHLTSRPVLMAWSCLSHARHKNTKTIAVRPDQQQSDMLDEVESLAQDKYIWRQECYNAMNRFEEQRINTAKARRAARKNRCHSAFFTYTTCTCDTCGRACSS